MYQMKANARISFLILDTSGATEPVVEIEWAMRPPSFTWKTGAATIQPTADF